MARARQVSDVAPRMTADLANAPSRLPTADELACLRQLERKVLWLSSWMIHNANHMRPGDDQLKVGGHQASCASITTLATALYFHTLSAQDRVAVKPHASPVFHAIQYLLGHQKDEQALCMWELATQFLHLAFHGNTNHHVGPHFHR